LFGLEPHFGCCTANYHQGWPKFISNLWLRDADGALSVGAYGPCRLRTEVEGVPVEIIEDTGYPFRESVRFTLTCQRPSEFALRLRIPAWCGQTQVRAAGAELRPAAKTICELRRVWSSGDVVELVLPMAVRLNQRPTN